MSLLYSNNLTTHKNNILCTFSLFHEDDIDRTFDLHLLHTYTFYDEVVWNHAMILDKTIVRINVHIKPKAIVVYGHHLDVVYDVILQLGRNNFLYLGSYF